MKLIEKINWQHIARDILKREMMKSKITLTELASHLDMKISNLSHMINRGKFSTEFFLQVLDILNVKIIDLEEVKNRELIF